MGTLIVTVKDDHEKRLVSDMLKKMRISVKELSDVEREDLGLSMLMKQAKRSDIVSEEIVMKKLRK